MNDTQMRMITEVDPVGISLLDTYQEISGYTNTYPDGNQLPILILGLCSEAGEVAGAYKKLIRDGEDGADIGKILDECGDVLWYLAQITQRLDVSLSAVARRNVAKLKSRAIRGVIGGSGDMR